MYTSIAEVFRTRQAVGDLTETVRSHQDAILRLGTTGAEKEAIRTIVDAGCKITLPDQIRAYSQLLLSAAMPEEDFPAFIAATAILLIDRLTDGGGTDDLFWNWDAFRDHYRLADPPVRASLMNGFRMAQDLGRVTLRDGPQDLDCQTRRLEDVLAILEGSGLDELAFDIRREVSAEDAGLRWSNSNPAELSWQALSGFRYLYERPSSMAPADDHGAPLIPWA